MIAIISAGLAPGIALLSYFYLKDQYDNEPVHMVIRSFMLGVILVFPTMFIQYVLQEENIATNPIVISFVTSGFRRIIKVVYFNGQCLCARTV